jgi:hypothetical protein
MYICEGISLSFKIMCNQQWRPRSTNYGHPKKARDMEQEPILLMGTDRMIVYGRV